MSNNNDVKEFTRKLGLSTPNHPTQLSFDEFEFRLKCLYEEVDEFANAENLPDMIDALIDLVYFAHGTAIRMGVDWERHWDEVHAANMKKIPGRTKRGFDLDAIKPDGWTPPDHTRILHETKSP